MAAGASSRARHLAEIAIGMSRAELEAVLDLLPTAVVLAEPETGVITYANGSAHALAGGEFPMGEAARRYDAAAAFLDEQGAPIALEQLPSMRAARGERIEGVVVDWHQPRGVISLLVSADMTPPAPGRDPVAIVAFEDVTALRRAEREAKETGALLDALLEREREARERAEVLERRSRFLARAGEVLAESLDIESTLQRLAELTVERKCDGCAVDLVDPGGRFERVASARRGDLARPVPSVTAGQLRSLSRKPGSHFVRGPAGGGVLVVPMLAHGRVSGAMSFAWCEGEDGVPRERMTVDLAIDLARRASAAVENARLYQERDHIAQTLQRSLLPPRLPQIAGFQAAARYRAAGEGYDVGGDFYDVFPTSASGWTVVLGDVCGKGPEAAALTALARYTVRAAALVAGNPSEVLDMLNAAILRDGDERFMTAVCAHLETAGAPGRLRLACAGHPVPIVVRASGEVEMLRCTGTIVGLEGRPRGGEVELALDPGDAVVLYTDGVTEAGAPEVIVTADDLVGVVRGAAGDASSLVEALEARALEISGGKPRDDIAIVALCRCSH